MDMFRLFGNTQVPPLLGKFDTVFCRRLWLSHPFASHSVFWCKASGISLRVLWGSLMVYDPFSDMTAASLVSALSHVPSYFPRRGVGSCVRKSNYHGIDKRCHPTLQDLPHQPQSLACSLLLCLVGFSLHTQTHLPSKQITLEHPWLFWVINHEQSSLSGT